MKKISKYTLVIFLLLVLLTLFLPWKNIVEAQLKQQIAKQGLTNIDFQVASVGLGQIDFSNLTLADMTLPALSISYSPLELLSGDLREINAKQITLHKNKLNVTLSDLQASLVSQVWRVGRIDITGAPVEFPPLSGKGKISFVSGALSLSGDILSDDKKTTISFEYDYNTQDSKGAQLNITNATLPWNEGILATNNLSIPINSDSPIPVKLNVKQVSLNSLLSTATSNKATATGVVSGIIPIVINRDGTFIVKKGDLKADKAGTIILSPDVIPSDAPQVALVREVLQNFHYSIFSMGVESADNKQLVMLLSLEGNNPDVYNGRVVKLNVNLTGDVIELITQSLNILHP